MKPRIAVTMGDPGGVGPEVIIKALTNPEVAATVDAVVIGASSVLREATSFVAHPPKITAVESLEYLPPGLEDEIRVYDVCDGMDNYVRGAIDKVNGQMSHASIVSAARAVLAGQFDAMCTAPIAKEALFQAGFTVPGHTELLAELCKSTEVRMMLVGGGLRVVLQTIHVALKDVPGMIDSAGISKSLQMIADFAERAGLSRARIAVCGLNPHAGENGHFGLEEIEIIRPAIEQFQSDNVKVTGPLPADTVFHRALKGEFDFVLAMYHDQGLIPVKTLDFHGGVNVTVGLPLIRTSPDHGTAFDLAGKGTANASSMTSALLYAAGLTRSRI